MRLGFRRGWRRVAPIRGTGDWGLDSEVGFEASLVGEEVEYLYSGCVGHGVTFAHHLLRYHSVLYREMRLP